MSQKLTANDTVGTTPQGMSLPGKTTLKEASVATLLSRLMQGENLRRLEAENFVDALLDNDSTDAQIGAALVALAIKGETVEELAGVATAMRAHAVPLRCTHNRFLDTAGTGSSVAKTFNVSTAAAFVIAGAGLPVAKHGGRAATSLTGSADVLAALGVQVNAPPEVSERCLNEIGICFMFAPLYHIATARVSRIRRELRVPTIFNLLGPLTNPAGAPTQILGVWHESLVEPLAQTLAALGTSKSWVVHGLDGLDEITLADRTIVAEVEKGNVRTFELDPEQFGLRSKSLEGLRAGDAKDSAITVKAILEGKRRDKARDLVIANAAAGLVVGGMSDDLIEARLRAEESIDSGLAKLKLDGLIKATNT